jgi:hypothetical protein
MKVIDVEAPIYPRKAYVVEANEQEYLNFTKGIEVLPAQYYESDNGNKFYFKQHHPDGTPGWKGGGYECTDTTGASRAFHTDSLIIHPRYFKRKAKAEKIRTSTGTGKRGRPKMDPSLKKEVTVYVKTGGKRGRPKMDPTLKKSTVYVKTGGKRGRPRKDS